MSDALAPYKRLTIKIGSATIVDALAFPNATDYLALDAGSYDLKVCADADNSVCPLDPGALDLAAGTTYSVFAIGSLDALSAPQPTDDGGNAGVTPPPTDTVAADEAAPASGIPAVLLMVAFGAALVGALRVATVRARR